MSHRQIKVLAEQAVKAERERQTHRKFNARMRLQAEQRLHLNGDDHHDAYGDNEDEEQRLWQRMRGGGRGVGEDASVGYWVGHG